MEFRAVYEVIEAPRHPRQFYRVSHCKQHIGGYESAIPVNNAIMV